MNACRPLALLLLAVFSVSLNTRTFAGEIPPPAVAAPAECSTRNSLDTQEFQLRNARLPGIPGIATARQNVTAWHITQGSWNGQDLNGLFLVLVQSASEGGSSPRTTNCYVSREATPAQRTALVGAFLATNPQLVSSADAASLRVEPGVISIQISGGHVVLHVGLVA